MRAILYGEQQLYRWLTGLSLGSLLACWSLLLDFSKDLNLNLLYCMGVKIIWPWGLNEWCRAGPQAGLNPQTSSACQIQCVSWSRCYVQYGPAPTSLGLFCTQQPLCGCGYHVLLWDTWWHRYYMQHSPEWLELMLHRVIQHVLHAASRSLLRPTGNTGGLMIRLCGLDL